MEKTSKRGRDHYEAADLLRCVHGPRDNTLIARRSQSYQPRRNRRSRKSRGLRFRSICTLVPPSAPQVQEEVEKETANIERDILGCEDVGRFKLSVAKGREKTKAGIERTRRKLNRITVFGSWSSTLSKNEPQSEPVLRRTQRRSGHDFSADFITQAELRHRPNARDLLEEEVVATITPFACIATQDPKSTSRIVVGQTKRH